MKVNDPLNVIWIVIDGARNYRTGLDDRDRPAVMDAMKAETVNFETAVTSAPSSILAGSAMMTGMDCAYISRHFSEYRFDNNRIFNLPNALRDSGYQVISIHDAPQPRFIMKDLLLPLPRPRLPKGFSQSQHWTNQEILTILNHQFATRRIHEPCFILLWFDVRRDPKVSAAVQSAIDTLRLQGLFDRSFFVMCSDHGYPDPATGLTERTMRGFTHDMVVTDDNILVPLLIRYPGSPVRSIRQVVGLIDVAPTILNVLKVEDRDELTRRMDGRSLVPLIEGGHDRANRVIRTDTRLQLASGRITALRGDRYKFVYYHDSRKEEFYDLLSDPKELCNVIDQPGLAATVAGSRLRFRQSQDAIDAFHLEELAGNYGKSIRRLWPQGPDRPPGNIIILTRAPRLFLEFLVRSFRETFPGTTVDHLVDRADPATEPVETVGFDHLLHCDGLKDDALREGFRTGAYRRYDLAVMTTENSRTALDALNLKCLRLFAGRRLVLVDYNLRVYSRFMHRWIWPFRRFADQWEFYKYEPALMVRDIVRLVRSGVASRLFGRKPLTLDAEWAKQRRDRDIRVGTGAEKSPPA